MAAADGGCEKKAFKSQGLGGITGLRSQGICRENTETLPTWACGWSKIKIGKAPAERGPKKKKVDMQVKENGI